MKKKKPVTRAGYLSKNPAGAIFASLQKHDRLREKRPKKTKTPTSQNGGNGPHPAESLPSAGDDEAAAPMRLGLRFLAPRLELSSSRAGRSCLPHIRFPPSPTPPIGRAETKLTLPLGPLSLGGFRRRDRGAKVPARDSTRDSMISSERD